MNTLKPETVFDGIREELGPFVEATLSAVYGARWRDTVGPRLRFPLRETLDLAALFSIVLTEWSVFQPHVGSVARSYVNELRDYRNRWAHQEPIEDVDMPRLVDTATRLLRAAGLPAPVEWTQTASEAIPSDHPSHSAAPAGDARWNRIAIIACTKAKLRGRHRARDLYTPSKLFTLSLRRAEDEHLPFVILSSLYGIVLPEQEIDSYDRDVKTMSRSALDEWRLMVRGQLTTLVTEHGIQEVVFFAGRDYRDPVRSILNALGVGAGLHPSWDSIRAEAFG